MSGDVKVIKLGDLVLEPDGLSGYRDRPATVLKIVGRIVLIEYREADGSRTAIWVEHNCLAPAPAAAGGTG